MATLSQAAPTRLSSALRGLYRLGRARILGEDLTRLAKSTPVKPGAGGKLASSRSKTGDPKCSAAVSAWKTGSATAETHKTLAQCRAMAKGKKQGERQRAAGNEAKAQATEHRAGKGETIKARGEKAKGLRADREADLPRTAGTAGGEGGGLSLAGRPGPQRQADRPSAMTVESQNRGIAVARAAIAHHQARGLETGERAKLAQRLLAKRMRAAAGVEAPRGGTIAAKRAVHVAAVEAARAGHPLATLSLEQQRAKEAAARGYQRPDATPTKARERAQERSRQAEATAEPEAEQTKKAEPASAPQPSPPDRSPSAARARIDARLAAARKLAATATPGTPAAERAKRLLDRYKGRDVQAAQITNRSKGEAGFSKIKALREKREAAQPKAAPPSPANDDLGLDVSPEDEAAWEAAQHQAPGRGTAARLKEATDIRKTLKSVGNSGRKDFRSDHLADVQRDRNEVAQHGRVLTPQERVAAKRATDNAEHRKRVAAEDRASSFRTIIDERKKYISGIFPKSDRAKKAKTLREGRLAAAPAPAPPPTAIPAEATRLPHGPARQPKEHEIGGVDGANISQSVRTPTDHLKQIRSVQQAIADGDPRVTPAEVDRHLKQLGKLPAHQLLGVARDFHGRSAGIGANKGQILERIGQKLHGDLQKNQAESAAPSAGFADRLAGSPGAAATAADDFPLAPLEAFDAPGPAPANRQAPGWGTATPTTDPAPTPATPAPAASSLYAQAAARQAAERARTAQPIAPKSTPEVHARVEQAFAAADKARGGQNWVSMADLRKGIGGTREEQDAAINDLRRAGKLSLDSHEGRSGPLTDEQRAAVLEDAGGRLAWASRRDPAWGTGQTKAEAPVPGPGPLPPPSAGSTTFAPSYHGTGTGRVTPESEARLNAADQTIKQRAMDSYLLGKIEMERAGHPVALNPDQRARGEALWAQKQGKGKGAATTSAPSRSSPPPNPDTRASELAATAAARRHGAALQQEVRTSAQPALPAAHPASALSPQDFATRVQAAAARVGKEGRFGEGGVGGHKVFIGDLHRAAQQDSALAGMPLDDFKRKLTEGNQARTLDLSRADLVEAMDPKQVAESEAHHFGANYHFLRVPKATNPAVTPAPAPQSASPADSLAHLRDIQQRSTSMEPAEIDAQVNRLAALPVADLKAIEKQYLGANVGRNKPDILAQIGKKIHDYRQSRDRVAEIQATPTGRYVTTPATPAQIQAAQASIGRRGDASELPTARPSPPATVTPAPHDLARSIQNRLLDARPAKPPRTPAEREVDQLRRDAMAQAQRVLQAGSDRFTADPLDQQRLDRLVATYDQAARALQAGQAPGTTTSPGRFARRQASPIG